MLEARVNDDLKGTLILPSVGSKAYGPGGKVLFSEEQYHKPDIQNALNKKHMTMVSKAPKAIKMVRIYNPTNASLIIPGYGPLRAQSSISVKETDLKMPDINRLTKEGKIMTTAPYSEENDDSSPVDEKMNAVVHKPKSDLAGTETKEKKKKGIKAKHVIDSEDAEILDMENSDNEESDILFVDIEQKEARISQHPILSKNKK